MPTATIVFNEQRAFAHVFETLLAFEVLAHALDVDATILKEKTRRTLKGYMQIYGGTISTLTFFDLLLTSPNHGGVNGMLVDLPSSTARTLTKKLEAKLRRVVISQQKLNAIAQTLSDPGLPSALLRCIYT